MIRPIEPIAKDAVLDIHDFEVEQHGGMAGLRDAGLLEAAIAQPWQSFDGIELYPSIIEKAARIGYEIIRQHPFTDGNKRTGGILVGVLLRANGQRFKPRADDYLATIMGVADGSIGYDGLVEFVRRSI